ncbi:MAG TPA: RNA polymerase sigma factor [Longimicrobium sp.]|nr:RNA polymerase sigma factor [Longimicrobium sp.]
MAGVPQRWRAEAFVQRFRPHLLLLARRVCASSGMDPEDLVHETLESALENFDWLSAQTEAGCRGWLGTTLSNRFIDACRRRRTEVLGVPGIRLVHFDRDFPGDLVEEQWASVSEADLREAVKELDPKPRRVFELHSAGKRYREISEELQIPMGTVGSVLSEARRRLKALLTERIARRRSRS